VHTIDEPNDRRVFLRGQDCVRNGDQHIPAHTLIGPYGGLQHLASEVYRLVSAAQVLDCSRYAQAFGRVANEDVIVTAGVPGYRYDDSKALSLLMSKVNDPSIDVKQPSSAPSNLVAPPNVAVAIVWHQGWPHAFFVSTRVIAPNEELLMLYSDDGAPNDTYWGNLASQAAEHASRDALIVAVETFLDDSL
jgi:hypothetical protein